MKIFKTGDEYKTDFRPYRLDQMRGPAVKVAKNIANSLSRTGMLRDHVHIFTGASGTGKSTMSYIVPMAMNCIDPQKSDINGETIEPCNKCRNCKEVIALSKRPKKHHSVRIYNSVDLKIDDLRNIVETFTSNIGRDNFATKQFRAKALVFEEAHELTKKSFELFKAPLEKLSGTDRYIFFTTTESIKKKFDPAIRSRITDHALRHWDNNEMIDVLNEIIEVENSSKSALTINATPEALEMLAKRSFNNMREALKNLQFIVESNFSSKSNIIVIDKDVINDFLEDDDGIGDAKDKQDTNSAYNTVTKILRFMLKNDLNSIKKLVPRKMEEDQCVEWVRLFTNICNYKLKTDLNDAVHVKIVRFINAFHTYLNIIENSTDISRKSRVTLSLFYALEQVMR